MSVEQLGQSVEQLTRGWNERIEYKINITQHSAECVEKRGTLSKAQRRHHACDCPIAPEARAKAAHQQALCQQLRNAYYPPREPSTGNGGKPKSRPPASYDGVDLLAHIAHDASQARRDMAVTPHPITRPTVEAELTAMLTEAHKADPEHVHHIAHTMRGHINRARLLLGYDKPMKLLASTVCGQCGGALAVAADALSDVRCAGTPTERPCGQIYRHWQWAEMLP